MVYRVELTPRAQQDLGKIYAAVTREAPFRGSLWFDRFEQSILSLSQSPERCMVVAKLCTAKRTVRRLIFGRKRHCYRVYFAIFGDVVKVLHIRHGARREPKRL
jgi:plasmid stabilization system protein ParE